jgi:hypothetical protein
MSMYLSFMEQLTDEYYQSIHLQKLECSKEYVQACLLSTYNST